ncbi:MAG: hypothetical protein IJ419_10890 [Agathobacter sp.]|nr:hypothetical protein [Agathobacter sp.]
MIKRIISILLAIICIIALTPIKAQATTFNLENTDMCIYMDEEMWYVFTRENIKDNPELSELGITHDKIETFFQENDAYMYAMLIYNDGKYIEMFVRKQSVETDIVNLATYQDIEVVEFAQGIASNRNVDKYYICNTDYKYINLEYQNESNKNYIWEFVTIINQEEYSITFGSNKQFNSNEYSEMESIIGSISFKVNGSTENTTQPSNKPTEKPTEIPTEKPIDDKPAPETNNTLIIICVVLGATVIITGIVVILTKKKKK